jgi:hypothetical protein
MAGKPEEIVASPTGVMPSPATIIADLTNRIWPSNG